MKTKKSIETSQTTPSTFILLNCAMLTLYFNPSFQDPFNSPKFWILMIGGSWLVGFLFIKQKNIYKESRIELKVINLLVFLFIFSMFVSTLASNNRFIAVFGDSGRRLGFLTYLFFVIFMVATYRSFNLNTLLKLFKMISLVATLILIYGFMQTTGNDFASWNNPYNSIIGTFGNPNFASAGMAIFAIICYCSLFINKFSIILRTLNLFLLAGLVFLIARSDSLQGLVVLSAGIGFFTSVFLISKYKKLGLISLGSVFIVGSLAIMGMLQKGPFSGLLYKPSVSVRGYYWDAAIEMFKDKPFIGVGIDQYGQYFKLFRDVQYPLNYGFELTSTNAHSIPLQLLSTGGLFVGVAYVFMMIAIAFIGVKSLFKLNGQDRLLLAGVISAWLGFQAQSFISIENIGLGIWNWVFSGAIMAIYKITSLSNQIKDNGQVKHLHPNLNLKISQPIFSGAFALTAVFLVSLLYTGDSQTMQARSYYDQNKQTQSQEFYTLAEKGLSNNFNDPYYKLLIVEMLVQSDNYQSGMSYLNKFHSKDPKNLDYLRPLAIISEKNSDLKGAIGFRKQIAEVDPWNLDNYLRLGYLYKSLGDKLSMEEMKAKIVTTAPNHPIAETARTQLIL